LVTKRVAMVLVLTTQEENGKHVIIDCVIFHPDNNVECYIPYLGVLDTGDDTTIRVNKQTFKLPHDCNTTSWCGQDIAKFLLSMIQITATLLYLQKWEKTLLDKIDVDLDTPSATNTHPLYLQVRLEVKSPIYAS
jgi:hypothetical protein